MREISKSGSTVKRFLRLGLIPPAAAVSVEDIQTAGLRHPRRNQFQSSHPEVTGPRSHQLGALFQLVVAVVGARGLRSELVSQGLLGRPIAERGLTRGPSLEG